jgi:hypothetical protein
MSVIVIVGKLKNIRDEHFGFFHIVAIIRELTEIFRFFRFRSREEGGTDEQYQDKSGKGRIFQKYSDSAD